MNITWKELYVIVMTVHTWGVSWQHQNILFHCDNLIVVTIWVKGSTKSPEVMALIRLLYFGAVCYNVNVSVQHISSTDNKIAYAISCFSVHLFQGTGSRCRGNTNQHPCMASTSLKDRFMQLCYHGIAESTR